MRSALLVVALVAVVMDVGPSPCTPRACSRDRSGTSARLLEDTYVQRAPGETSHDFPMPKGSEIRTHQVQGDWVFIHCDADTPTGGSSYTQGWVPQRVVTRD